MPHLTVRGLGPHAQPYTLTIPATGCTLSGPSQSGKTRATVHALLAALTGAGPAGPIDPQDVTRGSPDDAPTATARYVVGAVGVRCDYRTGAAPKLTIERYAGGVTEVISGPQGQAAHLAALGMEAPVIRAIVIPGEPARLASSTPQGRGLRDLLTSVLPPSDLRADVAEVMEAAGQDLRPDDPLILGATSRTARSALMTQSAAHRHAAEATGAARTHAEAVDRLAAELAALGEAPAPERVTKARDYLAAVDAWAGYDRAAADYEARLAAHAEAEARANDWHVRRAALGEAPTPDGAPSDAEIAAARKTLAAAERHLSDLRRRVAEAEGRARALRGGQSPAQAPEVCPTCRQPLPDHTARRLDAEAMAAEGEAAALAGEVLTAEADVAAARTAEADLRERVISARAGVEAHAGAVRALGPEPRRAPSPGPAPEPPHTQRPPAPERHADAARALIAAAERHAQDAARLTRALADARARAEAATTAQARATTEAARVEVLVRALREAPAAALARHTALIAGALQAVGGAGAGVAVVMDADADTCEVYVDGRPWAQASTGRQTLADYGLRQAVRWLAARRAAAGLPLLQYGDLPVIVDGAQAWSGAWPAPVGGPAVLLVTAPGQALGQALAVTGWPAPQK
jgi:hypothetical protein